MPSRGLSRETLLSIELDAIYSRSRYVTDPAPVIAELHAAAGDRLDVLTESVALWVWIFEDDYTRTLCTALRELPDLEMWIAEAARRRSRPDHSTPPLGIRHA